EAIAENIANTNNPDFERVKTDFANLLNENLDRTLKTTHERHIAEPESPERKGLAGGKKEEIDLSREMAELAENQIRYDFAARVLRKNYQLLNMSISGRT
ncbi:MAG: flagellar basal body rod protein FlgB, partial [Candidatus Heimdallarchaeota archaeon]|nr:flagellar basal body rod protein FlgB [Candidatus Heimdallarchaeota archaeon]